MAVVVSVSVSVVVSEAKFVNNTVKYNRRSTPWGSVTPTVLVIKHTVLVDDERSDSGTSGGGGDPLPAEPVIEGSGGAGGGGVDDGGGPTHAGSIITGMSNTIKFKQGPDRLVLLPIAFYWGEL